MLLLFGVLNCWGLANLEIPAFVFLKASKDNNPVLKTKADMSKVCSCSSGSALLRIYIMPQTNCISSDLIWTGSAIPTVALWSCCQYIQANESVLWNYLWSGKLEWNLMFGLLYCCGVTSKSSSLKHLWILNLYRLLSNKSTTVTLNG